MTIISHTILAMRLSKRLHVFFSCSSQVKRADVVFTEMVVSNAEIVEVHGGGITQRSGDNGTGRRTEHVTCN